MSLETWATFIVVCTLFSISPGPGAISSMSNALSYGFNRSVLNILGLQCALLIHLTLVALGLGTIFTSSEIAFSILKYVGAVYLIYLGIRKWTDKGSFKLSIIEQENLPDRSIFARGSGINLTNPKSIVFFSASLPQFIDPVTPQIPQFLILAISIVIIDGIVMASYGYLASTLRGFFEDTQRMRIANRVFGSMFVLTGFALSMAKRRA